MTTTTRKLSDPVSFIEPAPKEPDNTPLDKDRERSR